LVDDKLRVHVLELIVSKEGGYLGDLDLSRLIELLVRSVVVLVRRKNVTGSENYPFVLWILDESDPLDGLIAYLEAEFFVSWALLAFRHVLGLDKLRGRVL
jgi:hypothetical protein